MVADREGEGDVPSRFEQFIVYFGVQKASKGGGMIMWSIFSSKIKVL